MYPGQLPCCLLPATHTTFNEEGRGSDFLMSCLCQTQHMHVLLAVSIPFDCCFPPSLTIAHIRRGAKLNKVIWADVCVFTQPCLIKSGKLIAKVLSSFWQYEMALLTAYCLYYFSCRMICQISFDMKSIY